MRGGSEAEEERKVLAGEVATATMERSDDKPMARRSVSECWIARAQRNSGA